MFSNWTDSNFVFSHFERTKNSEVITKNNDQLNQPSIVILFNNFQKLHVATDENGFEDSLKAGPRKK